MDRCNYCGRRLDRPGHPMCKEEHPKPDLAQRIVERIEGNLNDRKGVALSGVNKDLQDEIRDTWAALVRQELEK